VKSIYLYNDKIGRVDLINHMGDDLTIVNSARVSFGVTKDKLDNRDKKLIKYLVKHRHTSTFEHNVVTFRFVVPMFVRSQHMRHRTWSYNEISRRYTDADFGEGRRADMAVKAHVMSSLELFNTLMSRGVCREQARMVLPQNLYTEYYGTVNLNNLLKFIGLRRHAGAQWEIQRVAEACLEIATSLWPEAVGAYRQNVVS
jgi:thymidylate synthase (FAD)